MSNDRRNATSEDLKSEVLAKVDEYTQADFPEASRLHQLVREANPSLCPRLWYGIPGYARTKDSAVLCFFRKDTLITFGVTESVEVSALPTAAQGMASSAWYITELTAEAEAKITDMVRAATQ
jgi:hypothetical protein